MTNNFVPVSEHLIDEKNTKHILTAVYCYVRSGLDNYLDLNICKLIQWSGYAVRRGKGESLEQFTESLYWLHENNYIKINQQTKSEFEITVNRDRYFLDDTEECKRYAIVFISELQRLQEYYTQNKVTMNFGSLLLLLSDLRMEIGNRAEYNPTWIECYCTVYKEVANDTGLSYSTTMNGINILVDCSLLYVESLPKYKDKKGDWHNNRSLFCNAYNLTAKDITFEPDKDYYAGELDRMKKRLRV